MQSLQRIQGVDTSIHKSVRGRIHDFKCNDTRLNQLFTYSLKAMIDYILDNLYSLFESLRALTVYNLNSADSNFLTFLDLLRIKQTIQKVVVFNIPLLQSSPTQSCLQIHSKGSTQ